VGFDWQNRKITNAPMRNIRTIRRYPPNFKQALIEAGFPQLYFYPNSIVWRIMKSKGMAHPR